MDFEKEFSYFQWFGTNKKLIKFDEKHLKILLTNKYMIYIFLNYLFSLNLQQLQPI